MRRLLLISNSTMHGGAFLEHCQPQVLDFLGAASTVLFVPYALADHDGYARKAAAAFERMGKACTSVHQAADPAQAVEQAEAVFVGGGNTFRLLKGLLETGVGPAIRKRSDAGMPYMGASAGTNVATVSIRTTNDMPIVFPPTFDALGLVPFNINPHYLDPDPTSSHMGETREQRLAEFHEENPQPVVGLREGAMLRVEGSKITLIGKTGVRLFRRGQSPEEFADGADLSFLLD